ncbi:hypothetical protein V6N11_008018 [Hibiscus sabdariffa]|uniref:Uncharacterized protein n=1 Tax=Hibiscus sabdariffa TaxID=183260 RepID=A0ABR2PZC7_9ROSI
MDSYPSGYGGRRRSEAPMTISTIHKIDCSHGSNISLFDDDPKAERVDRSMRSRGALGHFRDDGVSISQIHSEEEKRPRRF